MRVGLIVPKFKQTGVARNRLKRRLRELARLRMLPTGLMADVIIRARPEAYGASFEALTADIQRALTQLAQWHAVDVNAPDITDEPRLPGGLP
jgi:ribonuclease P protein component